MVKCAHMKSQARWFMLSLLLVASTDVANSDELLIKAVKNQDQAMARDLIERRTVDVNASQGDGATALHWAVFRDDLETVKLLIESGANVEATNELGVMPLSLACTNRNASMIETLLIAGADPNATLLTGETPLMTAAHSGGLDAVVVLLNHGAEVNAKEPSREQTALMWALGEKHTEVARTLIAHGADVHATTTLGSNPLLFAAREGDLEATKMLLDAGADVNTVAKDKLSVLHVATLRGHAKVAVLLLDRGANPNADGPGYTSLHWAAGTWETELNGRNGIKAPTDHEWNRMRGVQEGKLELVKALLDHGADPNVGLQKNPTRFGAASLSARPKGATPFALAAMAGEAAVMRMLADHGADPFLTPENGVAPLMMAAGLRWQLAEMNVPESDSLAAVKMAVELGADVNVTDPAGNTALHGAARIRSVKIIQFLVDNGAEVNVVNELGQSPLFIANRYWKSSQDWYSDEPSAAGALLREMTLPDVVSAALEQWASIPRHVRERIQSLLRDEMDQNLIAERHRNPLSRLPQPPSKE